jgi:hypothetical protein
LAIETQSCDADLIARSLAQPDLANVPAKTGGTSNWVMKPVVLNNDTVPACLPVRPKVAPNPVPAPKVKASPPSTSNAG